MKPLYLSRFAILIMLLGCNWSSIAQTSTTFSTPGGPYSYVVPAGVTRIAVDLVGANGGNANSSVPYGVGGKGGRIKGDLAVTPGQTLYVYVGGVGGNGNPCCTYGVVGGVNGGGRSEFYYTGSGGGGTDIRTSASGTSYTNRLIVAGGGGGAGYGYCCTANYNNGGHGGAAIGQTGFMGNSQAYSGMCYNATGGTQSAGGNAGTCGCSAQNGGLGVGGNGATCYYGAGGGGGYYGGGGSYGGGGGGGSSFPATDNGTVINVAHTQGYNSASSGNGSVAICAPNVGTISGDGPLCVGGSLTLTASSTGGTWVTDAPGVATVSTSGVVTAVGAGIANISYSVNIAGCGSGFVAVSIVVNPSPAVPTGTGTVCPGNTVTLTDATSGGSWSSGDVSKATVGAASGIVTGVGAGLVPVIYTLTATGCSASKMMTVNPLPAPISGTAAVCAGGGTTALSDITLGGSWTSSSPTNATITGTGLVTGLVAGASLIYYTLPTGCARSLNVIVNALPSANTGVPVVCVNGTTTLTNSGGGTWSSSNAAIAAVAPSSGTVTGISAGTATISYTLSTGCSTTTNVLVNPAPAPITGGTSVCEGSTITLASASTGGIWTSSNNSFATVAGGVVSGVSAGPATISYTLGTGCSSTANIVVNTLPSAFNVTGGGGYCVGTPGVHVGLSFSSSGVSYKLYNGGSLVATIGGSNSGLDFGLQTATGTYTVVGSNSSTGCANNMTGSVNVSINPLPNIYTVTGGGNFCPGSSGVHVGTSGSELSSSYQLYVGGVATGAAVAGTGAALDFGLQTMTGSYTVVSTNTATGCSSNMSGSAAVAYNTVPTAYNVNGGGAYCIGGSGVNVTLDGSDLGVTYQLYMGGLPSGASMTGTGAALNFGLRTTPGSYTVVASNTTSGCTNNMNGAAVISISALPNVYNVTGGGNYCSGGAGAHVGLNFSSTGVDYRLMRNITTLVTTVSGTNAGLDFGAQSVAGSYSVVAVDALTGCQRNMTGSVSVAINPLPVIYTVSGGGTYCSGTPGLHVNQSGSTPGIQYQLFRDGVAVGPALTGSGSALDFGVYTAAGNYTVVATNAVTSCTSNMIGSATININTLPAAFNVSMAGTTASYCAGGTGIEVLLNNSEIGVNYQLLRGASIVGASIPGTGTALTFGNQTVAGNYTVVATNTTTGCFRTMIGNVNVVVNPAPPVFTVTGGGNYCDGSSTGVHIGLSGSSVGVDYQLFGSISGAVGAPVSGTGSAIDMGIYLTPDVYTIVATNQISGCYSSMSGTVMVDVNPLPGVYTTGGSNSYCFGGSGVSLNLSGSDLGINYQLLYGGVPSGPMVAGDGSPITFSPRVGAGSYTVRAINSLTGCAVDMSGLETISINPLPPAYAVTGGGTYCSGGVGMPVDLGNSDLGVTYQLYYMGSAIGSPIPGSGLALNFGLQTAVGGYNVVATDDATACVANMSGTATINMQPTPAVQSMVGGGSYCAGGTGVHVGLGGSETGIQYQLYRGTATVGTPVAGTGFPIDFGIMTTAGAYTVVASPGGVCASTMTGSSSVSIDPLPTIYSLTGGGSYCESGTGVHIGLSGSNESVKYQLYRGSLATGSSMTGTGSALDFGLQTGAGFYSVKATDTITGCSSMGTSTSISISTIGLPTAYGVTGGGNYCQGGTGVHVTLAGSTTNVNYQLYRGGSAVGSAMPGTGTVIDFGTHTTAGNYTIVGTDAATLCANNMTDTAKVAIDPILTPVVNMVAHPGVNIVKGQRDTVVASATNAGTPTYQWYLNGFIIAGATDNSYSSNKFVDRDSLSVAVTSVGTCGGVTTWKSTVIRVSSNVGVQQVSASNSNMQVMPNPSRGTFAVVGNLGTNSDEELSLEVTDMAGRVIYSNKAMAVNGNVNAQVQLNGVANGMYLLTVHSGMENKVFHVVIEQ